jgi:2-polyprenyl-6-methoxyphenol hydroxylase-like FAD-dependent oxidoreductase
MWEADDFYLDTISQIKIDGWSRGRVVLLGDSGFGASHLSGMGTSLAIVGAYLLAGELASTPDDHLGAFRRYEEQMKPFVTQCHKLPGGGVKGYLPRSKGAIKMRAMSTKVMTVWPMRALIARMLNKSDGVVLKNY